MTDGVGRPPRKAEAAGVAGTVLIVIGVMILIVAAALQFYTWYAETRWQSDQQALASQFVLQPPAAAAVLPAETATPSPTDIAVPTDTPLPTATPSLVATLQPAAAPSAGPDASPSPTATLASAGVSAVVPPGSAITASPSPSGGGTTATPTPAATPTKTTTPTATTPADPGRLIIPKLTLNTSIVPVRLVNGAWNIDKIVYEVALLAGTGFPGQPGNAAITGHVTLIRRGNGPLRWLEKLTEGDDVIVQQGKVRYTYKVVSSKVVTPNDVSVLATSEDTRLTIITCTDWDYLKADYTHRLVVTAVLASQTEPNAAAQ